MPSGMGARGPPGPVRLPPGPGMKTSEPWAGQHGAGRGWEAEPGAGWGAGLEDKRADMWSNPDKQWSGGGRGGGMRTSPSWEEPGGGMMPGRDWPGGQAGRPNINKDMIWGSKQFRILSDMGYRKEDVETALRNTNLNLEDALEMLNALNRGGGLGSTRGVPPGEMFGPRAGDPDYSGMRFPGPGPGPMPYPPGELPAASGTNPSRPGPAGMNNPLMMNGGPGGMAGPGRPQPSGPPSTSQLRVLVQQIQMAVQAGHLNPQILNQPLAPQTLMLLNQLLQQIKQLQSCQQQHAIAQASARPGAPSQALLGLTVQITKHKQQIGNLQNQITAQQAQYLKNQQPQPLGQQTDSELLTPMNQLNIGENGGGGGSKLLQIIGQQGPKDAVGDFARAPGSSKTSTSQSSPNLLLDNGPWSNGQGNTGWPEAGGDKPGNTSNSTEEDNFGIPEFVPGKAWKGATIKDPTEDPTLTPGSVAPTTTNQQANAEKTNATGASTTTVENSLGLTSSTWSFNNANSKESAVVPSVGSKESWNSSMGLPTSSSASNLTEMGQNLWGQSRSQAAKQPTPTSSMAGGSGWPAATNGLASSGAGWSNGTTTSAGSQPQQQPGYPGPVGQTAVATSAWLLLKNLTAQIDGSTLRTLCMQHGPLQNFHLYLTHGIALVKYSNGQEAKKVGFWMIL